MKSNFSIVLVIVFYLFSFVSDAQNSSSGKGTVNITDLVDSSVKNKFDYDCTQIIQNALKKYKKVILPNYPVFCSSIYPYSNNELVFQERSKLIQLKDLNQRTHVIGIFSVENVKIINANIEGDKKYYKEVNGEWGFGIEIRKSRNIELLNVNISNCRGDGIYISNSIKMYNKEKVYDYFNVGNIKISGGNINNVRRNGISIIDGEDILIEGLTFKDIYETAPKSAIDIEPNNSQNTLDNIVIRNIVIDNVTNGLVMNLDRFLREKKNQDNVRILVDDVNFINVENGVFLRGNKLKTRSSDLLKGVIEFKNVKYNNLNERKKMVIKDENKSFSNFSIKY